MDMLASYAGDLVCPCCGAPNAATSWPRSGDLVPFYCQREPGQFSVRVHCSECSVDWYVVWDGAPGDIVPLATEHVASEPAATVSVDATVAAGRLALSERRAAEAVRHLRSAATLAPSHFEAQYLLGLAYGMQGDVARMVTQLENALRLRADVPALRFNLGVAYGRLGRITSAVGQLEAALQLRPDYTAAQQALDQLHATCPPASPAATTPAEPSAPVAALPPARTGRLPALTRLGALHDDLERKVWSADGLHFAYTIRRSRQQVAVLDGKECRPVDAILGLGFTRDDKLYCHVRNGVKHQVLVDGVAGPAFDDIRACDGDVYVGVKKDKQQVVVGRAAGPAFDEIGYRLARGEPLRVVYVATQGGKSVVVANGRPGPAYDGMRDLVVSNDGHHVAYSAARAGGSLLVVDGTERPAPGLQWDTLCLSQDGQHVAYVAYGAGHRGQHVVVDGASGPDHEEVRALHLSDDGLRVAYLARHYLHWEWFVDGESWPTYQGMVDKPVFGAGGHRLAYVAQRDGSVVVVADGVTGPPYTAVAKGSLCFSPNGQRLAYVAKCDGQWLPVVDGQEGTAYASIYRLAFSPDGQHVGYRATKPEPTAKSREVWVAVLDGVEGPAMDNMTMQEFVFSPDSRRLAYTDGRSLVVDGVVSGPFSSVGHIVFSADSRRSAYRARTDGKTFVVLDGEADPIYADLISLDLGFRPDGALEYLACDRKSVLWRVCHAPAGPPNADDTGREP